MVTYVEYYSHRTKNLFRAAIPVSAIAIITTIAAIWVPTEYFQKRFGWTAALFLLVTVGLWIGTAISKDMDYYNQKELKQQYKLEHQPQDSPNYNPGGTTYNPDRTEL